MLGLESDVVSRAEFSLNSPTQSGPLVLAVRLILAGCWALFFLAGPALAVQETGTIATRLVKIIQADDSGSPIGFPSRLLYDPVFQETYIYGTNQRITIYNKDFFPLGSIGVGRGVKDLTAMAVDSQGNLYLARGVYEQGEVPRYVITVLNRALLPEREIDLTAASPELAGFTPLSLAVAADGTIYVVGSNSTLDREKGAMVLDRDGNFKRWLAPRALVLRKTPESILHPKAAKVAETVEDGPADDLPAFLKPSSASKSEDDESPAIPPVMMLEAPVALVSVYIDVNGAVYLLSAETSEAYVYDDQHNFIFKFGTKGGAKGKLSTPRTLAVDYPRRLIYVNDYMRHTILAYDYDTGGFVYEFGGKGRAPLWFLHPEALAVDASGRVMVADLFNERVQVIDPSNPERPVLEPIVPVQSTAGLAPEGREQPEQQLPSGLVGLEAPIQIETMALAARVPSRPVREITPSGAKKKNSEPPAPLVISMPQLAAELGGAAAIGLPAGITPPPAFEVLPVTVSEGGMVRVTEVVNALRAVVGVYGPVAALLGVGTWILNRGR